MRAYVKINVDVSGLENLRNHARVAGTLDNWADIAIEWMRAAELELFKRDAEIKELTIEMKRLAQQRSPESCK